MVSTGLTRARRFEAALALDPIPASKVQSAPRQFAELDTHNSSDSTSRWTPCPPEYREMAASGSPWLVSGFRFRARLGCSIPSFLSGQRGVTPAFGYSAPHPSAGGTSTLLSNTLLSAHYAAVRLLTERRSPFRSRL